jgi:hypothetical protein
MTVRFRCTPTGIFKNQQAKGAFHVEAFAKAREMALDELAEEAKALFEKTTATWTDQPNFIIRKNLDDRSITTAGAAGKIYDYVDLGTRPHMIYPKKEGGVLAFPGNFKPKTRVGVITSYKGYSGGATVFSKGVKHPGTQARGFSEIVQDKIQKRFPNRFKQVFDELLNT